MKTYKFNDFTEEGRLEVTMTEEEILDQYFDFWSTKMVKAGKSKLISKKQCIEDFVVINWAWEVDSNL